MDSNESQNHIDYNYSANTSFVSTSYRDSGELSTAGTLHSDTQFDSSTDETVITAFRAPDDRVSQEFISTTSIDRFDPEASPRSFYSRYTRRSIDTEPCGTLYEETVNVEVDPLLLGYQSNKRNMAASDHSNDIEDLDDEHLADNNNDSIKDGLLHGKRKSATVTHVSQTRVKADYRVGSCYHCLVSVPVPSLLAWILLFVSVIGWATSTWLGLDKGKGLLKWIQPDDYLSYEEIALIAVSLATVTIAVIYLIVATFSSPKMSRYTFSSSKKNTFGYCLSVTVIVFCFISVIFWTLIIALTMFPVGVLSVIHILVGSQDKSCLHLPSYGVEMTQNYLSHANSTTSTAITTTALIENVLNITIMIANSTLVNYSSANTTSVGAFNSTTPAPSASVGAPVLTCGDELDSWMEDAWLCLVPLLISIAFAVAIEGAMLGLMAAASSNARHLKERMEYISGSYGNSMENVNGNMKPNNKENSPGNNNQTDTQI